jgi:hypothetical protein
MSEHTRIGHDADRIDPGTALSPGPTQVASSGGPPHATLNATPDTATGPKVECQACPVLCQISVGRTGACDRYANVAGRLVRLDPLVLLERSAPAGALPASALVQFGAKDGVVDTLIERSGELFATGIGASTTYPDFKPAPFIVASQQGGVDTVTVVTEGIFSYCSLRVKVDTDRFLGPEQANVLCQDEVIGHVTTAEYGSQMLSLGGVHHLTGGSKREGRVTAEVMEALGNRLAVEVQIEGGSRLVLQAARPPVVDGIVEERMRVGCGSATIGMFARQWQGLVDEVIVIDDHITGVLSEHQAGQHLGMAASGIRVRGRRSTPGRYFQVAAPGTGWGGTDLVEPLAVIESIDAKRAWPGLRLLMVSTTGEHSAWFELDANLKPCALPMPEAVRRIVLRIGENCEPAETSILFVGGAGGSLRSGATENPVLLTQAIKAGRVTVTCGGAPTYIWPGGGITFMVDVARLPCAVFGRVPTPALVAPLEFSMCLEDYRLLGGHMDAVRSWRQVLEKGSYHVEGSPTAFRRAAPAPNPWPLDRPARAKP